MTSVYIEDNLCTAYKLELHSFQQCLVLNGCTITDSPEKADILVAGLCAAFEADEERSMDLMSRLGHFGKPLHFIGCLPRVQPKLFKNTNKFFAWQHDKLIKEIVPEATVTMKSCSTPSEFRVKQDYRVYDPTRQFVCVSLGCAFECTYCPHKLGAGNLVSRSADEIVMQIKDLIEKGTTSIILTGIDTASYGMEINTTFPKLLRKILDVSPDQGITYNIAQFNPEGVNDAENRQIMLECCSDPRVVDLQFPIQTSSSRLLKLMNRHYDMDALSIFLLEVKKNNPGIFLRTDCMIGFPTETEEESLATTQYIVKHFDEVAAYCYEEKQGTPITRTELKNLPHSVCTERKERVCETFTDNGLLVHSGGQDVNSLLKSDNLKQKMR